MPKSAVERLKRVERYKQWYSFERIFLMLAVYFAVMHPPPLWVLVQAGLALIALCLVHREYKRFTLEAEAVERRLERESIDSKPARGPEP
jgi:hypothetical protein